MYTWSVPRGSRLKLNITHVDNDMSVFWNGTLTFERSNMPHDPVLNESISLEVLEGRNSLVIVGANDGGPAHFAGHIRAGDHSPVSFDVRPSGIGIVYSTTVEVLGT